MLWRRLGRDGDTVEECEVDTYYLYFMFMVHGLLFAWCRGRAAAAAEELLPAKIIGGSHPLHLPATK
jgi:hypothetical protein